MNQPNKRTAHPSPAHFSPSFYPSITDPIKKHDHEISPASQYLSSCPIEANLAMSGSNNTSSPLPPANSYQRGFLGAFSSNNETIEDSHYLNVDPNQMEMEPMSEMLQDIPETDDNNLNDNDVSNQYSTYVNRNEESPHQFMPFDISTSNEMFNSPTLQPSFPDQSLQSPTLQSNNSNNQFFSLDKQEKLNILSPPQPQQQQQQQLYQSQQLPYQTSKVPISQLYHPQPPQAQYKQILPIPSSQLPQPDPYLDINNNNNNYFQQPLPNIIQQPQDNGVGVTTTTTATSQLEVDESSKITRQVKIPKKSERKKGRPSKQMNKMFSKIGTDMNDIRDSLNSDNDVKRKRSNEDNDENNEGNDQDYETTEEDEALIKAVKRFGEDWNSVGKFLGIEPNKCYQLWIAMPNNRKGQWSAEEDEILRREVVKCSDYKSIKWSDVAAKLPGRVGKQCRERYLNYLDPLLRKGDWSELEDHILFELQRAIGNKWTLIGKAIQRSDNDVKNHFYSRFRDKYFKEHPTALIPIEKLNEMTFVDSSKLAHLAASSSSATTSVSNSNFSIHRKQRHRIVEGSKMPPLSILLYYLALPPGYPYYPSDYKDYIRQYASTLPPPNYTYEGQPKSVILKVPGRKNSNASNANKSFKSGKIHKKRMVIKRISKTTPTTSPNASNMNNNNSIQFSNNNNKRSYSCLNEADDAYSTNSSQSSPNFYTIEGKRQMEYSPTGSTYIPTFCTKKVLINPQQQPYSAEISLPQQQQQSYSPNMSLPLQSQQQQYQPTYSAQISLQQQNLQLQQQRVQFQQMQQRMPKSQAEIAAFQEQARQSYYRQQKQKQLEEQQKQFIQPQFITNNNQSNPFNPQQQQQQQQQQTQQQPNINYGLNISLSNNNNNNQQQQPNEPPPYKYDPTKVSISPLTNVNKLPSQYSDILSINVPPPEPLPSLPSNGNNETDFSGLLNNIELDNDDIHSNDSNDNLNSGDNNDLSLPFLESENDNSLNIDFDYYYS